ncbi:MULTISPECIES: PglL family O-oligosaccharyltransferase [Pandoraea]|uniref:PglL family O-oligosaccharyltransferase n=1 Tax=Pandoraea TaxID=93217 RepID=UPI0015842DB5|nr:MULTISPECIES: O-antigen ligase family protein [Pandoraea]
MTVPTELPQLMVAAMLYGAAMLVAVNSGFWIAQLGWWEPLSYWMAAALTLGGGYAVGAQIAQVFHLEGNVPWLVVRLPESVLRRPFGNMFQPNLLATYLSFASAAVFYLWRQRKLSAWIGLPIWALLDVGICVTGSRTAWLQLTLLSLFGLWLAWKEKSADAQGRYGTRWLMPAVILPLLLLAAMFVTWANTSWGLQLEVSVAARMQQPEHVADRISLWRYSFTILREHWMFGVGWTNFRGAVFALADKLGPTVMANNAHNVLLDLLVKTGAFGTLLVIVPLTTWCVRAVRGVGNASAAFVFALILLGMLLIHAMLEYPQCYAYFLLPASFLIGVCERKAIRYFPPIATGATSLAIVLLSYIAIPWVYRDYQRVENAFFEVAILRDDMQMYRAAPARFFAPYGEYALTWALDLNREQLDTKLAMHRRALALNAPLDLIERQIVLLALAGRDEEALNDIKRLKNYSPNSFAQQYRTLITMLREHGADLEPFVNRVFDAWGAP